MRQQEVGCFRAFIQREDCNHRLARATRFQSLYKGLRLALGHRRIDRRRRYLHTGSGSCQRHRPNDRPDQRAIIRCSVDSHGETYACPRRATRTGPIRAQALS